MAIHVELISPNCKLCDVKVLNSYCVINSDDMVLISGRESDPQNIISRTEIFSFDMDLCIVGSAKV